MIFFFGCGLVFKVFLEFDTVLLLFYVVILGGCEVWGLSSLARDQTSTPSIGRRRLNHCSTREVLTLAF